MNRVERAAHGDSHALGALLADHLPRLRQQLAPRIPRDLRSLLDVEDLLQEVCVDACRDLQNLRRQSEAGVAAWLSTIARRHLIDACRALRSHKRGGGKQRLSAGAEESLAGLLSQVLICSATASRHAVVRESLASLKDAVGRLPEAYRTVVEHYDLCQEPIEQVAGRVGRSVGATFMLRQRAHRILADLLASSTA